MIKTAPHSSLSPQMWCIKKSNKRLVCTHPDFLARIWKLVDRKNFGLICFPRLIYCDQEPVTVHLFGCTYKAISNRYKICFTPKSLSFSMGASLLAVAKSIYYFDPIIIFHVGGVIRFAALGPGFPGPYPTSSGFSRPDATGEKPLRATV